MQTDCGLIRLFISAGEPSGDRLGAALVQTLRASGLTLDLKGVGGPALRAEGLHALEHSERLSGMGIWEVIPLIPRHVKLLFRLRRLFREEPFDAAILIDYPGFHLRLAPYARAAPLLVWCVSPQVWAWKQGRLHTLSRYIDHMLVLLPFELPFYQRVGLSATLVEHPILRAWKEQGVSALDQERGPSSPGGRSLQRIGLLPGSRSGEIRRHLRLLLDAAALLWKCRPQCIFELVASDSIPDSMYVIELERCRAPVQLVRGQTLTLLRHYHAAWVASGTATLEAAVAGVPHVVFYRVPWLTYLAVKPFIRVRWIGLPNLLAGEEIVPELIQRLSPERLVAAMLPFVDDESVLDRVRAKLVHVRERLSSASSTRPGAVVLQLLLQQGIGDGECGSDSSVNRATP